MLTQQYFALDSLATGYAAAIADVAAKTSANRGYTVTQVIRSASHDANIKIICGYVDDSDLTGDAADLLATDGPNALCVDRFIDIQDCRERVFPLLGEMARTPYPELTGVRYIAPDGVNTSGTEDGKTPWTAFDGPRSLEIGGGASRVLATGVRHIGCRGVMHKQGATFATTGNGGISFPDASATERAELGCDHPLWPAIILPTFTHTPTGAKGDSWVHEGGNIYSQADWGDGNQTPFQNALIVTSAIDPTKSVTWNMENAFYIKAADETSLVSGEWFTSDGIKMYVRMLDDGAPPAGFNIANRWDGLGGYFLDVSAALNVKLNYINIIGGGLTPSEIRACDDLTMAGGRIALADSTGYFRNGPGTFWKFCAATYGRRTYDIDDDITYDGAAVDENHRLVQELITDKGSAASAFAGMKDTWAVLMGQGNGPGLNSATVTNTDNIDGLYILDCNAVMANTRGTIVTYSHNDGHSLSARNGGFDNRTWQRFCAMRGGRHYDVYVSATGEGDAPYAGLGGAATSAANNISQDFLIIGTNGRAAQVGKGYTGLGWEQDNDNMLYTDGSGDKSGNIFRRFAIAGLNDVDKTCAAIVSSNEQGMTCTDYIVEDCNWHYQISRATQESVPYVALVQASVVTEVTENLLLGTGGTNTTLTLSVDDYIIFGFQRSARRVELLLPTAAAGTYTLAFEELTTGDTWAAVDNLSDGTTNLTNIHASTRRAITWNRNDNMIETDFDTATNMYFFRIRVASGSFSTAPVITRAAGRQVGGGLTSRGATVRDLAVGWNKTNSGTTPTNSSYVDVDEFDLTLKSGQTVETAAIFNDGFHTFTEWQAQVTGFYQVKKKLTTDAPQDSNHGDSVTAGDIGELP